MSDAYWASAFDEQRAPLGHRYSKNCSQIELHPEKKSPDTSNIAPRPGQERWLHSERRNKRDVNMISCYPIFKLLLKIRAYL